MDSFTRRTKKTPKTLSSLYDSQRVISLIRREPFKFKTITADNDTEFHQYKVIEKKCNTKFYFTNPYHSWERGANENVNGLIRQYLPKGTSMANLSRRQCDAIANKLNSNHVNA